MKTDLPKTIYLKDYTPYPYDVESLALDFDLREGHTIVTAKGVYQRKGEKADLYLYGEELALLSLMIDGVEVEDYSVDDKGLTIPCPAAECFTLEVQTRIYPEKNTRLEGLYQSGGNYCTQCEAEGFRRVTYYPDRPDVLTVFTVRIEADAKKYPVLLSNGNKQDEGTAANGRHFTLWHDPFPKPCYLFALVAGDLAHIHDIFTTKSGRDVDLYIYVRPGDEGQCAHAMESLKKAMKWDEDTYGLEYELDLFNIVAVSDFNMGAMENTSLNIFNTALVLAHPETATDQDFIRVESVIAHEYFHNWSGNRVTCRDWFQLSLKEGLTVFRDQEFSADMNSRDAHRIDDVTHLRRMQFPEDAGPLAHPVRPDNYIEINNFYTMTVYEKGAEVIRMMRTILGAENYRKGTDLYFSRYDGQAVTCDDFAACMEEASGVNLSQFKLWYSQAGTPEVTFKGVYDAAAKTYTLELSQNIPNTPGQTDKKPMHIPVALGLLGDNGQDLIETQILNLQEDQQRFRIENIGQKPVPSVLRNFSAPVKLKATYEDEDRDLPFLMVHDPDGFNRWEAGQTYYLNALGFMLKTGADVPECFLKTYGELIERALDGDEDKGLMARMLSLPSVQIIAQQQDSVDPDAIDTVRQRALAAIKRTYKPRLQKLYDANRGEGAFSVSPEAMGRRALCNVALGLLSATNGTGCAKLAKAHYDGADNMTDRVAALSRLADNKNGEREAAFDDFYRRFKDYPLVVDKWFALQAGARRKDLIDHLKNLRKHADFNIKNPNRTRSLYAAFAMNNPVAFHAADGSGYAFLTDAIIELNAINPQIAARLLGPMREWRRYTPDRQEKMRAALERILQTPDIAPDVYEIASKSLT
ncbi:MAG: aminopeptidase N [Alphaproteobacteria bacterium]|nr:aminopeptidase N [Alphaproteobacteria bacterium]